MIESGHAERIADLGEPGRLVPRVLTTRCRGCPALVVPLLKEQARGALFFVRGPDSAEFEDDEVERAIEGSERLEQYAIIKRSSERMNRLIDDLLDVNRIESGRFSVERKCQDGIEIADEAFATFGPIAESRGLHLRREVHGKTREVSVDRDRIMQVRGGGREYLLFRHSVF